MASNFHNNRQKVKLRPGDLVMVKSPEEILDTLDSDGAVDHLPFMPEMIQFCGRTFRVAKRAVKTCYYGEASGMRTFRTDDVVLLENVRCSGGDHDGCQKACLIFWRESWLRKVKEAPILAKIVTKGVEQLRARLKTTTAPNTYFCQASEILRATENLTRVERFTKCYSDIRAGNTGALQMIKLMSVWLFWKTRKVFFGEYAHGAKGPTPAQKLSLQSGELVEIQCVSNIEKTLDDRARNRGLYFSPAMRPVCQEQHRVERKLEKIIVDGTGEMRKMHNTVYLEDSMCGCAHVAFGGCPRNEFAYWREIWLRRVESSSEESEKAS